MNIWILVALISLGVLTLLLLWQFLSSRNKLTVVRNELQFFKKEKEYYEEAMIMISLNNNRIIFANESAKNLFSLNEENESYGISKKVQLRVNDDMPKDFFDVMQTLDNPSGNSFKLQNVSLIISGQEKKVNIFMDKSILDNEETLTCVIDMLSQGNETISTTGKEGAIDFLTGLPSQFLALSDINSLVIESKKKSESFGLFLLGIDHFKEIQSTLGLGHSNQVLKKLATHFIDKPDENISVYRMESDKFLFLINGLDEDDLARTMAKDLIAKVGSTYKDSNDVRLSSSIGVVIYPKDGENASKLIDNVYSTLDRAQNESESNIELFTTEHQIIREDELNMKEDIRKGLIKSEFLLYYQPIFDLAGEQMIGAEALLRWKHPKHGLIAADKFLDVAEKSGLIVDLGEYVFNEAILQRERCGVGAREDFQITINLSLKEMQVDKLIPRLETLFDKHKVEKHSINLDISEGVAMENIDKTANDFKLFKDFGLSLSLDHFGAGYSSFKYLSMLPVDTIKIDRSLIFDLTLNLKHQTTVKAIIELAHTLGYKVVAEGVETSQEAAILESLHCDYAQGYLYSRPLPSNEFEELLN
jgi:diguanylate cyclase (GGDEF)-like protein